MPAASIGHGLMALLLVGSTASADVVIDMPPPPPQAPASETVAETVPDAAESTSAQQADATPADEKDATAASGHTTQRVIPEALVRFTRRAQAQDSAGNPRGTDIASTWISSTSFAPPQWGGWGYDGWGNDCIDGYNWGWPGTWAITPLYWGGGWACPPYAGATTGWVGSGVSMGFGGSSGCVSGAAAVNLRLGNRGW